jgi:hypothetical protein
MGVISQQTLHEGATPCMKYNVFIMYKIDGNEKHGGQIHIDNMLSF